VGRTVDVQLGVTNNLLDLAVCLEISQCFPCERAVDLQAVDEGGDGDEAVGLDILLELVVGLLVENNGVLGLVLDCEFVSTTCTLRVFGCGGRDGAGRVKSLSGVLKSSLAVWNCAEYCVWWHHVPLPLDHFFFCFLPPVAAGA
jgi:hypothetical protein